MQIVKSSIRSGSTRNNERQIANNAHTAHANQDSISSRTPHAVESPYSDGLIPFAFPRLRSGASPYTARLAVLSEDVEPGIGDAELLVAVGDAEVLLVGAVAKDIAGVGALEECEDTVALRLLAYADFAALEWRAEH